MELLDLENMAEKTPARIDLQMIQLERFPQTTAEYMLYIVLYKFTNLSPPHFLLSFEEEGEKQHEEKRGVRSSNLKMLQLCRTRSLL